MQNLALNSDLFLVICLELHCTSYFMIFFFKFQSKRKIRTEKSRKREARKRGIIKGNSIIVKVHCT